MPQSPHRPTFPTHKDLCNLSRDEAERALVVLRELVASDLASVYTSAGSNDTRWNVWSEITRQRVPLPEWAADLLTQRPPVSEAGARQEHSQERQEHSQERQRSQERQERTP